MNRVWDIILPGQGIVQRISRSINNEGNVQMNDILLIKSGNKSSVSIR